MQGNDLKMFTFFLDYFIFLSINMQKKINPVLFSAKHWIANKCLHTLLVTLLNSKRIFCYYIYYIVDVHRKCEPWHQQCKYLCRQGVLFCVKMDQHSISLHARNVKCCASKTEICQRQRLFAQNRKTIRYTTK